MNSMKFELGKTVATTGVHCKMQEDKGFDSFVKRSLERYSNCDWGDTCEEDKLENEKSLKNGERILAVYEHGDDTIWIITEWDRSVTTILFPSEY